MTLTLKTIRLFALIIIAKAALGLLLGILGVTALPVAIMSGLSIIWLLSGLLLLWITRSVELRFGEKPIAIIQFRKRRSKEGEAEEISQSAPG